MSKSEARDSLLYMDSEYENQPRYFQQQYTGTYHDQDGAPVRTPYRSDSYGAEGRSPPGPHGGLTSIPQNSYDTRNHNIPPRQDSRNYLPPGRQNNLTTDYTTGGYHQREGYASASSPTSARSSWLYVPSSTWQWAFLAAIVGQAIVGLALEAYIFGRFQEGLIVHDNANLGPHTKTIPTYLSLFIFGFIYQLLLVYDAMRMKNTIQIIGLCLYDIGLLIEAAVQPDQIHDAIKFLGDPADKDNVTVVPGLWNQVQPFIIAVPCVIGFFFVLMSGVSWKLYHEFAWSIYKDISADLRMKQRYLAYQIYIALLKFDFFFFLAFTVQFLVVVDDTSDVEFGITVAAMPITIIFLILAAYWVRKETLWGMIFVFVIYVGGLAYFLFKLVRMYDGPADRVKNYLPARRSLTTFAVITVLLLVVTMTYAVICTLNFNKGLAQHVARTNPHQRSNSVEVTRLYSQDATGQVSSPNQARMTIE